MGRKSNSKGHAAPVASSSAAKQPDKKGISPLAIGAVLVAVLGIGVLAFWGGAEPAAPAAAAASADAGAQAPGLDADAQARAEKLAKFGPHTQATYPAIPFAAYEPPRPRAVVSAAYQFAAEHPEVLSYVPCFCGCERSGHGANHDCFVKSRDANGDVTAWDEHGVECAVCIDVATRSRQMHASGASVRDIRAAIDREFGARVPTQMHTPHPPAAGTEHGAH